MRTFVVLASVVTVATLAYVFGPDFIEAYNERESLVAERQVVALSEDVQQRDGQTFMTPQEQLSADGKSGIKASLSHLRESVTPPTKFRTTKHKAAGGKIKKSTARHERRRTAANERAELRKMGLMPASATELKLASEPRPEVKSPRPLAVVSPMAGRWVEGLSGPKARLDMGVKTRQDGCATAYSRCERRDAPRDISLTGVVVKTERLASHPERAVDGKVKTGNYRDETPAVYVE